MREGVEGLLKIEDEPDPEESSLSWLSEDVTSPSVIKKQGIRKIVLSLHLHCLCLCID